LKGRDCMGDTGVDGKTIKMDLKEIWFEDVDGIL
jgi:hypothetical protein